MFAPPNLSDSDGWTLMACPPSLQSLFPTWWLSQTRNCFFIQCSGPIFSSFSLCSPENQYRDNNLLILSLGQIRLPTSVCNSEECKCNMILVRIEISGGCPWRKLNYSLHMFWADIIHAERERDSIWNRQLCSWWHLTSTSCCSAATYKAWRRSVVVCSVCGCYLAQWQAI